MKRKDRPEEPLATRLERLVAAGEPLPEGYAVCGPCGKAKKGAFPAPGGGVICVRCRRGGRAWTDAEDALVRKRYPLEGGSCRLAADLCRTRKAIRDRALVLAVAARAREAWQLDRSLLPPPLPVLGAREDARLARAMQLARDVGPLGSSRWLLGKAAGWSEGYLASVIAESPGWVAEKDGLVVRGPDAVAALEGKKAG